MNKESVLFGVIGLLVGVIITGFAAGQAVNNNNTSMMNMMGMHGDQTAEHQNMQDHGSMSMDEMNEALKNKNGHEFDKLYLEMMIEHHEGAVKMAELASTRAYHDEIKNLSTAIISAQNKEISDMKSWQQKWEYINSEQMHMMHE
jgi:uncharacterized protein (DUF305 family)